MRYRAKPDLEMLLMMNAPAFTVVEHGPSTLAELREGYAQHGVIPVWIGGSDHTIYSSPVINHAYRAWHDSFHLSLGAEFHPRGEARVNAAQQSAALHYGLCEESLRALHFDTWGQVAYSARHDGEFPTDQAAFVAACFVNYDEAIRSTF